MDPALKVDQLSVNFDKTPVLWDIHFSIPQGILLGIIGPNGAGKSTLLKALLGLIKPFSGKIEFFGKPWKKALGKVAYVPQRNCVDWDFPITVEDVVLMGRYPRLGPFKWARAADRAAVCRALEMVGMLPFADRQINELSGGQQQRVFIARALVQDADLYLMDEPFAGVDLSTENALMTLFRELKSRSKTLCIVHHDLHTVEKMFDWVLFLNTCLVAIGPTQEVFQSENIQRTYGQGAALLGEVVKLSQNRNMYENH